MGERAPRSPEVLVGLLSISLPHHGGHASPPSSVVFAIILPLSEMLLFASMFRDWLAPSTKRELRQLGRAAHSCTRHV